MESDSKIMWNEMTRLKDRHESQQQTINKVLYFLTSVYAPERIEANKRARVDDGGMVCVCAAFASADSHLPTGGVIAFLLVGCLSVCMRCTWLLPYPLNYLARFDYVVTRLHSPLPLQMPITAQTPEPISMYPAQLQTPRGMPEQSMHLGTSGIGKQMHATSGSRVASGVHVFPNLWMRGFLLLSLRPFLLSAGNHWMNPMTGTPGHMMGMRSPQVCVGFGMGGFCVLGSGSVAVHG